MQQELFIRSKAEDDRVTDQGNDQRNVQLYDYFRSADGDAAKIFDGPEGLSGLHNDYFVLGLRVAFTGH